MKSNQPKSTGSMEVFSGPLLRQVEVRYMLIDSHGGSDETQHKSYITCLESLLNDRGIGEELERMLWESDINPYPSGLDQDACDAVSDWFYANINDVEALMSRYSYRVINVLKFKNEVK